MTFGKGGLNIKDYPFAFSLAVLFFPSILNTSNNELPILFGITIFGGTVGSILTITNPVGILIRYIYIWTCQKKILSELRFNEFLKSVINKNFASAITSPSISYEIDKLVGMFYFIVILSITSYRLFFDQDFNDMLNLEDSTKNIIGTFTILGLVGVIVVFIINIIGFKSISHLRRIITTTILFLADDISNLSLEGRKFAEKCHNDSRMFEAVRNAIRKLNREILDEDDFYNNFDHSEIDRILPVHQQQWKWDLTRSRRFWQHYLVLKEISKRYNIDLNITSIWFNNTQYIPPKEFDESISQLQSVVDSRDWRNAELKTVRILDRMEQLLSEKGS